jgi:hypothetical protein
MTALMTSAPSIEFCAKLGRCDLFTADRHYFIAYDPKQTNLDEIFEFFQRITDGKVTKTNRYTGIVLDGQKVPSGTPNQTADRQPAQPRHRIAPLRISIQICDRIRDWLSL